MKLNALSILQFLAMLIMPLVIFGNARNDETAVVWSCVVVSLLFVGVSIVYAADKISSRENVWPRRG